LFRDQLGMEAQLFCADNTQAYMLTNADHIVVAFRGTEAPTSLDGIKDWLLTDALNLLIVPEGRLGTDFAAAGVGAKFHQGFINAIGGIWDPLRQAVEAELKKSERPLWLTGHSLGGALALFAAWLFNRSFIAVHQVYTFGAPRVGNPAAAQAIDRAFPGKIYRYVNGPDPIPQLPTASLIANDYGHCEKEIAIGTAIAESFLQGFAGKTVNGVLTLSLMDEVWGFVKGRLDAHALTNYIDYIKAKLGNP
jgi:triacylglycerol lipase